jgi:hypothetical protein
VNDTPTLQISATASASPSDSSRPTSAANSSPTTPSENNTSTSQSPHRPQPSNPLVVGLPSLRESYSELNVDIRKSISEIAAVSLPSVGQAMYKLAIPKENPPLKGFSDTYLFLPQLTEKCIFLELTPFFI